MTKEEKINAVTKKIARWGYTAIRDIVSKLSDNELDYWLIEEEDEEV